MIPSFKPGIMSSNRIRKAAAGDVTPDAANWGTLGTAPCGEDCGYIFQYKPITGIDSSITLRVEYANSVWQLYYETNPYIQDYSDCNYSTFGTAINNNGTITISNDQSIMFMAGPKGASRTTETVTVKNQSDGDAVIDTFDLAGGGGC